ncbi:right-handed parallel beta-helix repeat-containing protein [Thalassotalea agariperforans]
MIKTTVQQGLSVACLLTFMFFSAKTLAEVTLVSSSTELQEAINNAKPGDEIVIKKSLILSQSKTLKSQPVPFKPTNTVGAYFQIKNISGTAAKPIILRGESDKSSEFPTLLGQGVLDKNYVLHFVQSNYWVVQNLRVSNEEKGIMLDQANYNVFDNIEISNIGHEAIHFRSSSSYNVLKNCLIKDTGVNAEQAGYGEGIYVGYHNGHQKTPQDNSDHNHIGGCTFGPNITGEAIDIKAGTKGTLIEHNIFSGAGGGTNVKPAANSFIDIKGTDVTVRYNTFNLDGSSYINHLLRSADEHKRSNIYGNTLNLKTEFAMYEAAKATIHSVDNKRLDGGNSSATKSTKKQVNVVQRKNEALEALTAKTQTYRGFNFN